MSGKSHYQVQWVQKDSNQQEKPRKSSVNRYQERKGSGSDSAVYKEKSQDNQQEYEVRHQDRNNERTQFKPKVDRRDERKNNEREPTHQKSRIYYQKGGLDDEEDNYTQNERNQTSKTNKKWRKPMTQSKVKQVNDLENRCYDINTLIKVFRVQPGFPKDASKIQEQFSQFFTKISLTPLNIQDQTVAQQKDQKQKVNNGDSDPEWMTETAKLEEVNFDAFGFKNIESLLDEKRTIYQKGHGTYERKQVEKEEKMKLKEKKECVEKELQMEKQKYKQMKELKEQNKNLVFDIFNMSLKNNNDLNQLTDQTSMTLEQIERGMSEQYTQSTSSPTLNPPLNKSKSNYAAEESNIMDFITNANKPQETMFSNYWKIPAPIEIVPPPIPQERLDQQPFSLHALMNSRKIIEPLWFYVDQSNKVQGGFHSVNMDQWYVQKYLPLTLKISWLNPGQWITLEQFLINLEQVNRGQLESNRAAEQTSAQLSQLPGYEYMMFMKQQQHQNGKMNGYLDLMTMDQQQLNISMYLQMTQMQSSQPQQNQQQNQYHQQQLQAKKQAKKHEERVIAQQQMETLFNIGMKKQNSQSSQQPTQNSNGIIIDSKEFPTLGEVKKVDHFAQ